MRLVLLGPPGAGKGTQAKILTEQFHIPHISTGDILRDQVQENSALGKKVAQFVNNGELVPDDIVVEVVRHRLAKPDAQNGFILDGFPRTFIQADKLTAALKQLAADIDLVIYFKTNPEVCIKRLSGRRVCAGCGTNFHLVNMPPKVSGVCDFCQQKLYLREDDQEQTVKKRLAIYEQQTASLIDYYKKSKNLREVSGDLDSAAMNSQLKQLFAQENLIASS